MMPIYILLNNNENAKFNKYVEWLFSDHRCISNVRV